jgi:hypothetical protein
VSERRTPLGDWTCPSGNNVVAYYRELRPGQAVRDLEWDAPPPLSPADELYYLAVIRPAIVRRAQEYLERPGRAMVATL